ncbi:nucleoporin_N domain-containing protein, partial [Haematococcus lacustris]
SGAVDQLVLDNERHILYCHTQAGVLQAFDLGPSGQDAVKKVAEVPDFYQAFDLGPSGQDAVKKVAEVPDFY